MAAGAGRKTSINRIRFFTYEGKNERWQRKTNEITFEEMEKFLPLCIKYNCDKKRTDSTLQ